jgi:hypothetical protein
LPQIIEGIPLRTRTIMVDLDRPGFALNPTNCGPLSTDTTVTGDEGASAEVSAHYQVANCTDLSFDPKLSLRLRGSAKRRGHPSLRAVLEKAPGEANLRRVRVTLPKSQLLDTTRIQTVCTRVNFAADACPEGSRVGWAEAVSPLLEDPLKGPVYLRSSSNRLPDLVLDLKGQVDVEVAGRVDSVQGRLRTDFATVPDLPVSKFVLRMDGGRRGLLINTRNFCEGPARAHVEMTGQNDMQETDRVPVKAGCRRAAKGSGKRRLFHRKAVR